MSYSKITIQQVAEEIEKNKFFLPAIQRKFVWEKNQIETLFDSIIRNYPIGTFLFWHLEKDIAQNYVFYEFLRDYDDRSPYNKKKNGAFVHPEIVGVLDGQQRLSALYLGLLGSYTEKKKGMWRKNPNAYERTELYLNVLNSPFYVMDGEIKIDNERNFDFKFMSEREMRKRTHSHIKDADDEEQVRVVENVWLEVGDVLRWSNDPEFDEIFDQLVLDNKEHETPLFHEKRQVKKVLSTLHKRIREEQLINYFSIDESELDDILKIFVRVNSGGTELSKTDLLFSTIVATWPDGREKIEALQQSINKKGRGFNFTNDYLMRCCLVITDGPVVFKVKSFKTENVERIKKEWSSIEKAIKRTVDLLVEFGFEGSLLSSQNATIIIAYFIKLGGELNATSKSNIKRYLIHALLKGVYGSSQNQVIKNLRDAMSKVSESGEYQLIDRTFEFDQLLRVKLPAGKSFRVTISDIEQFLDYKKSAGSFFVLALLYPQLDLKNNQFHQDHIHPYAGFDSIELKNLGLSDDDINDMLELRDRVPNLQLLEGSENQSKQDTPFEDWLEKMDSKKRAHFLVTNYIDEDWSLQLKDFWEFYINRRHKLYEALKEVLVLEPDEPVKSEFTDMLYTTTEEDEYAKTDEDYSKD